jgi:hypothetical protein
MCIVYTCKVMFVMVYNCDSSRRYLIDIDYTLRIVHLPAVTEAKTVPNSEDAIYKALHAEHFFFYMQNTHIGSDLKWRYLCITFFN